jgi:hypothetical protein
MLPHVLVAGGVRVRLLVRDGARNSDGLYRFARLHTGLVAAAREVSVPRILLLSRGGNCSGPGRFARFRTGLVAAAREVLPKAGVDTGDPSRSLRTVSVIARTALPMIRNLEKLNTLSR